MTQTTPPDAPSAALPEDQPLPGMPAFTAIYRYEVPVDDRWHALRFPGRVLHVAARRADTVELWAISGGNGIERHFRVFGTGHPLPSGPVRHVGTTLAADGQLVWHLFERGGGKPA